MNNKVTVNIYGKDFTVGGDKPAEQILRIATHVDLRMKQVAGDEYNGPLSSLAILTAMNICEELFEQQAKLEEMQKNKSKIEADGQHYEQMWDEAKRVFLSTKKIHRLRYRGSKSRRKNSGKSSMTKTVRSKRS